MLRYYQLEKIETPAESGTLRALWRPSAEYRYGHDLLIARDNAEGVPYIRAIEPIGLAVGIAGLAGLFSTCIDAVERVDSYRDFKHNSHSLYVEFEAEKRRFEQWGSATGINKSTLSSAHHPALNDPQTLSTAKDLLSLIQNLYTNTDDAAAQPFMPGNASTAKDKPSVAKHVQPSSGAPNLEGIKALDVCKIPELQQIVAKLDEEISVATQATIVQLFQDIIQAVPSCTFILDGLDECAWMGGSQGGGESVPVFLKTLA
ncbi:ankyrin repeat domain-containing protein 52 [Colletotrichum kahawae]|uniref:Ankyrin repeat domain-containing protein 52 n=1 Tax=Colletotrichum kahawae TaxID=34407 RepID=A0AAD9YGZ2_COLKA|nr:ankyrin repeat domain-containing protein 52 [Colletotrichum kahawae]